MNNPFFGALGGGNGFMQMMQQFQQFKANFHGDPKAEVEKLLQSGRLNQQVVNCYKPVFLCVFRLVTGSVPMLLYFSYLHI